MKEHFNPSFSKKKTNKKRIKVSTSMQNVISDDRSVILSAQYKRAVITFRGTVTSVGARFHCTARASVINTVECWCSC